MFIWHKTMTGSNPFGDLIPLTEISSRQSSYNFTSSNNASPARKRSADRDKRSSLLHSLFGRSSSKRKMVKSEERRRVIIGGDQVKLPATKMIHLEQGFGNKIEKDINTNQQNTNKGGGYSFPGLRYDFNQTRSPSSTDSANLKQLPKDNLHINPFVTQSSVAKDESISSLSDPISIRQHPNEEKPTIESVQSIPNIQPLAKTLEKTSFKPYQHKYTTQTPAYHYPKRLSAIEALAKKYSLSSTSRNSTGLFWYSANHQPMNRTMLFSKRNNIGKQRKRTDSSSDSDDTSSSSNTSTTPMVHQTSSSSSSSSMQSRSTTSSSQSEQRTIKTIAQYNCNNYNEDGDLIRVDLKSKTSRISLSTNTTTTTTDDSSSSSSSTQTTK
ncbi:unnamed protein product [Adineta ricciae]|uniref:Uncharacterized protein n=1 Tax=Adineta ricciae TaxID=249248 RepID=A0A814LAJ4_ADIRI|nr:unnamed protein product [Adineta ricciae]